MERSWVGATVDREDSTVGQCPCSPPRTAQDTLVLSLLADRVGQSCAALYNAREGRRAAKIVQSALPPPFVRMW